MMLAGLISSICIANDRSVIIPVERTRIVLYMYSNTLIRLNVYENVSRVDIYIYIYILSLAVRRQKLELSQEYSMYGVCEKKFVWSRLETTSSARDKWYVLDEGQ